MAALPRNFQLRSIETATRCVELRVKGLYLHHACAEPNPTHHTVISPCGSNAFGEIVANNWTVYDGPDPSNAAVVARVQGLHIQSGNWNNFSTLVFDVDWFKGSTLHVMGIGVYEECGQWGIVGGTGDFCMAQGVINRKFNRRIDSGNIIELDIYAIFPSVKLHKRFTREGLVGGPGGEVREVQSEPRRLEIIKIGTTNGNVDSLEFTYVDRAGVKCTERWGSSGSDCHRNIGQVNFGPTEYLKQVNGTTDWKCVKSLSLVTNVKTYGPFGQVDGTPFSLPEEQKSGHIAGFFARAGTGINAIGVLVVRP